MRAPSAKNGRAYQKKNRNWNWNRDRNQRRNQRKELVKVPRTVRASRFEHACIALLPRITGDFGNFDFFLLRKQTLYSHTLRAADFEMKNLAQKIHDLSPAILEILRVSGAAGASIGVSHRNETHFSAYGYRDILNEVEPDENTLYHLASLSKSFTAAAIGILVHENKITWDQTNSQISPRWKHPNNEVQTKSTVVDCLSHRVGLATKNALWLQDGHEPLLNREDTMPTASYLEVIEPLGSKWIYNNWMYDIGSEIIEAVSGTSYGEFISEKILVPLGLNSTYSSREIKEENRAHGYMPASDCQLTDVGQPLISEEPSCRAQLQSSLT